MNGPVIKPDLLSVPSVKLPTGIDLEKVEKRFWAKVDKNGPLWNGTPCWIWKGAKQGKGYGTFSLAGKSQQAHRVAFMLIHRAFPLPSLTLDHLCHNRPCVNTKHFLVATHQENILAGNGLAAREARQTHCVHGHPLSAGNFTIKTNGGRECILCHRYYGNRKNKGIPQP